MYHNEIYVGFSMGKIKWALRCWIICYQPCYFFNAIPTCHFLNPRSNFLLDHGTPKRTQTIHLFRISPLCVNVVGWKSYDDRSCHCSEFSHGYHNWCRNTRLDDTRCRVFSVAKRTTSCVLEVSYVLYFIPQVCITRIV